MRSDLPKNLYTDPLKRENTWRYRRPDGSFKTFRADRAEAIRLADTANRQRGKITPKKQTPVDQLPIYVVQYIAYREALDPRLTGKQSWKNRCASLKQFARVFGATPLYDLHITAIRDWWDTLTGHAQATRRPELNKFFNWLMMQSLVNMPSNPFSTADDRPRVMNKPPAATKRQRMSLDDYQAIYQCAPDWLQIAMDLSLYTTMRRGDLCELRFDTHINEGFLGKRINKAHALGHDSNLRWELSAHPKLKQIIDRARLTAFSLHASPYIISRQPKRRADAVGRNHYAQATPDNITKAFKAARVQAGVGNTSFHEIRSLAAHLYGKKYDRKLVKDLMAHTDESMTAHYQAGHETQWHDINISL